MSISPKTPPSSITERRALVISALSLATLQQRPARPHAHRSPRDGKGCRKADKCRASYRTASRGDAPPGGAYAEMVRRSLARSNGTCLPLRSALSVERLRAATKCGRCAARTKRPRVTQWQQGQDGPCPVALGSNVPAACSRPRAMWPCTAGAERWSCSVSAPHAGHDGFGAAMARRLSKRLPQARQPKS